MAATKRRPGSPAAGPLGANDGVAWTREERAILDRLDSPAAIQAFLDSIPYSTEPIYRCPRSVLRDGKAHCFDGAVLAAAALRRLGERPLFVDLRAVRDDDHVVALFERRGRLGAIAKSNFAFLRYREPIYRTVRELVLTYFDLFFNVGGEKTLRSMSGPVDLRAFDPMQWAVRDETMDAIAAKLNRARHVPLLTEEMVRDLSPADPVTYEAVMHGVDPAGLYDPVRKGDVTPT